MDTASIQQIRRFNRTVTERVGALSDQFLGRRHSLGESRLLWEIGTRGAEIRELRARLSLDSGYVSRLLRSLERQGLLAVEASRADGRVRRVRLTKAGAAERAELDRRANTVARGLLKPLSSDQRAKLLAAMGEVERLLSAALVTVSVEDPATADARWCIGQYFAELDERFEGGFDPTRGISADAHELTWPAGLLLVARLRDRTIGCVGLKLHRDAPAEMKRMWVAPEARGLGVGRRLLAEVEEHARAAGATVIHLETNGSLREAIELYRRNGYVEVAPFNREPYAHHWFEKRLGRRPTSRGAARRPAARRRSRPRP
jgi:DNA-binding MarR family transcriptional regulator/GNAT superfamily N-acetyltransferase